MLCTFGEKSTLVKLESANPIEHCMHSRGCMPERSPRGTVKRQRHEYATHTLARSVALDNHSVGTGLERHHDPGLEPAGIVDVGKLDAAGFKVVATEKPEPGVVVGAAAGREGVLSGTRDREAVVVLAGTGANDVGRADGVVGEAAVAGQDS